MKKLIWFIVLAWYALVWCGLSYATDYTVSQSGSGKDYSAATFNALTGSKAGNTYYFSGTFSTRITINISGTASTNGSNDVKLDGWEAGVCTPLSEDCSLSADLDAGLTISAGSAYLDIQDFRISSMSLDIPAVYILENSNHVRFKKNLIYDAGGRSYNHSCLSGSCNYFIIEENRMRNFSRLGNSSENFNFDATHYTLIKNNWVSMEAGATNSCSSCNIAASHTCSNLLIENNDFHDGYGMPSNTGGWSIKETGQSSETIFRFNKFHGMSLTGLGINSWQDNPRVWNIYIYGNFFYDNQFGALVYYYADHIYLWSNLMIDNSRAGFDTFTQPPQDPPTDVFLYNNTIAYNGQESDTARGGILHTAGSGHKNMNNILYNNRWTNHSGMYHQIYDTTSAEWEHNTLYHSSATATWYYDGAIRTLNTMQVSYGREDDSPAGEIADPGFTNPDGADNTHGTADDDYTLTAAGTLGADLSQCFSVDLSGGDAWFETNSGYGRYIEPCLDDALDPGVTDWTTTPPTVATIKRDTYGWSRGAYAFSWMITDPIPADNATGMSTSMGLSFTRPSGDDDVDVYIEEKSGSCDLQVGDRIKDDADISSVSNADLLTHLGLSGALDADTTYCWRVDVNYNTTESLEGGVLEFTTAPGPPSDVDPEDGIEYNPIGKYLRFDTGGIPLVIP